MSHNLDFLIVSLRLGVWLCIFWHEYYLSDVSLSCITSEAPNVIAPLVVPISLVIGQDGVGQISLL